MGIKDRIKQVESKKPKKMDTAFVLLLSTLGIIFILMFIVTFFN